MEQQQSSGQKEPNLTREPYERPRANFVSLKLEERVSACHYWETVFKCGNPRS